MAGRQPQGATITCHRCQLERGHLGSVVLEVRVVHSDDARQDQLCTHLHVFQVHRVC
jgi:hypothetical protein